MLQVNPGLTGLLGLRSAEGNSLIDLLVDPCTFKSMLAAEIQEAMDEDEVPGQLAPSHFRVMLHHGCSRRMHVSATYVFDCAFEEEELGEEVVPVKIVLSEFKAHKTSSSSHERHVIHESARTCGEIIHL